MKRARAERHAPMQKPIGRLRPRVGIAKREPHAAPVIPPNAIRRAAGSSTLITLISIPIPSTTSDLRSNVYVSNHLFLTILCSFIPSTASGETTIYSGFRPWHCGHFDPQHSMIWRIHIGHAANEHRLHRTYVLFLGGIFSRGECKCCGNLSESSNRSKQIEQSPLETTSFAGVDDDDEGKKLNSNCVIFPLTSRFMH